MQNFYKNSLLLLLWFMLIFSVIQISKTTFIQTLFCTFKTVFVLFKLFKKQEKKNMQQSTTVSKYIYIYLLST